MEPYVLQAARYAYKHHHIGREVGDRSFSLRGRARVSRTNLKDPDPPNGAVGRDRTAHLVNSSSRVPILLEFGQVTPDRIVFYG